MNDDNLKLEIPASRNRIGIIILAFLGITLIYNALKLDFNNFQLEKVFFTILGSAIVYLAFRFANKAKRGIIFNKHGLYELDGKLICLLEEIKEVDTSPYTFKPANGFIIKLRETTNFGWSPGLWWKYNKRMTIGGMISKQESVLASQILKSFLEKQ